MLSPFPCPERLNNPDFRDQVLPKLAAATGLLVVDEAHRIYDWGHDFRPGYRRLRTMLAELPPGVPVLATTATANARVTADVAEQLGTEDASAEETLVPRGPLDRQSISLNVPSLPDAAHRLGRLADHLGILPGSGIVHILMVATAEEVTAFPGISPRSPSRPRSRCGARWTCRPPPTGRCRCQRWSRGSICAARAWRSCSRCWTWTGRRTGFAAAGPRPGAPGPMTAERYTGVTRQREETEQQAMPDYAATTGCRMQFLRRQLDDEAAVPCGRYEKPCGARFTAEPSDASLDAARGELGRPGVEVQPRRMWPTGRPSRPQRSRLPGARCCWWMTRPTSAGPWPWPRGCSAVPGREECSPWASRYRGKLTRRMIKRKEYRRHIATLRTSMPIARCRTRVRREQSQVLPVSGSARGPYGPGGGVRSGPTPCPRYGRADEGRDRDLRLRSTAAHRPHIPAQQTA
jgi:hypothetical protein